MKLKIQHFRLLSQAIFTVIWALGIYYQIAPVIGALFIATFIFGNFFCSWVCPFGTAQELMGRLGSLFLKKKLKTPPHIQKYLKYSRYIILALILLQLVPQFVYEANAYTSYLFAIIDYYDNMLILNTANVIMISYLIIGIIFDRPFCNYVCSEGVKFGIANLTRIFSIKRDQDICINCKLCDKECPMNISVANKAHVRDIQCINCMECISACPKKDALKFTYTGWKRKPNNKSA